MLFKKKVHTPSVIDLEITRLYEFLAKNDPYDAEYAKVLTQIGILNEYRDLDRPEKIKKDTLVNAAAQILGVGFIVGGESIGNKILSKNAFSMLPKTRN